MTSAFSALKWALFKFQKTEALMLAKTSYTSHSYTMTEIIPTFIESEFQFISNSRIQKLAAFCIGGYSRGKGVPKHIEARPKVPTYVETFTVFGATAKDEMYTLAVDIPDEKMARRLAKARQRRQEADVKLHGCTDDIYVLFPNGSDEKIYRGHLLHEQVQSQIKIEA